MSMPALTVGPGLRCNIDTTWFAKVACLLSSGLPYAAEITHIQRLNPGWRATSIIELYIWLSVDPGSLSSIYTIPSVAEYMDVAEGGLGSGYWAKPRHDGKPFGFAAALSRGWVTSNYQKFNDLVAYISDVQNMAIESFGVLSREPLGAHFGVLSYITDLSDYPEAELKMENKPPTLESSIKLLGSSVKHRRTVNHDSMVLVQERH
ncbi:hypothetical protein FG05_10487 [Fusarium graminearum]|nr:hypothetical protein FG05_10487 [Fusarium graminearum]